MATPAEVAREIHRGAEIIARSVDSEPTGVTPGYNAALGGTVKENGKLRYVGGASAGSILVALASNTSAQTIPTATNTVLDFDDVQYDPGGTITTGASWVFTPATTGTYQFFVQGLMETKTWVSTKELLVFVPTSIATSAVICDNWPIGTNITAFWTGWGVLHLSAGDTAQVKLFHTYGSSIDFDTNSQLAIVKIA